jgi:hypothetical protein
MKKAMLLSLLFSVVGVMTSQAVIITWSSDEVLTGTTSASLVYVSSGDSADILSGTVIGTASGLAIDGTTLYAQQSQDLSSPVAGGYFVVLFNDSSQYSYSALMAYNDTSWGAFTADDYSWTQDGSFSPSGVASFSEWAAVPEPSTAMLLVVGAAAVALRRRKRA